MMHALSFLSVGNITATFREESVFQLITRVCSKRSINQSVGQLNIAVYLGEAFAQASVPVSNKDTPICQNSRRSLKQKFNL